MGIKGLRVIENPAAFQRTEASVEMIEARVDEPQGNDFDIQPPGQVGMRIEFAAKAVSSPKAFPCPVEQGVPCPFEGQIRRQFKNFEALFLEPFFEMFLFALAFAVEKTAKDEFF